MRFTAAFAILFSLAACGNRDAERREQEAFVAEQQKTVDAARTRYAATVRRLIDGARKLEKLVSDVPRADAGARPPSTQPSMKLAEIRLDDPSGNTDVLLDQELPVFNRGMLATAGHHLEGTDPNATASLVEDILSRGARMQYFVVVRVTTRNVPKMVTNETYSGGGILGDAVAFDLRVDPPKLLGTFPVTAELVDEVKVRNAATNDEIQYALDAALRKALLNEVDRRLTTGG